MGKTIGLRQLAQKVYVIVTGLSEKFTASFGKIEDAFDCIIYGDSGNGKSSLTASTLEELLTSLKCKCHYVTYEEGHAMTVQENFIHRYKLLEKLGNVMDITDHLTYDELVAKMSKKQSAKIWVIDSIQASGLTWKQCEELKRKFVLSRKRKIIIYISWAEGKKPHGAVAKSIEYYANIKIRVEKLVAFFKSRYGGNKPFVIWEEGARRSDMWGEDFDHVVYGAKKKKKEPSKTKKSKNEKETDRKSNSATAVVAPTVANDHQVEERQDGDQSHLQLGGQEQGADHDDTQSGSDRIAV